MSMCAFAGLVGETASVDVSGWSFDWSWLRDNGCYQVIQVFDVQAAHLAGPGAADRHRNPRRPPPPRPGSPLTITHMQERTRPPQAEAVLWQFTTALGDIHQAADRLYLDVEDDE
jgi:hypothetical protein